MILLLPKMSCMPRRIAFLSLLELIIVLFFLVVFSLSVKCFRFICLKWKSCLTMESIMSDTELVCLGTLCKSLRRIQNPLTFEWLSIVLLTEQHSPATGPPKIHHHANLRRKNREFGSRITITRIP
jgi:hypothetical protein